MELLVEPGWGFASRVACLERKEFVKIRVNNCHLIDMRKNEIGPGSSILSVESI